MKTIEVYDPAMCCSTGVCGPSVDPALARFAADLEWLAAQGAQVKRFNLAQQPDAFAANEIVTGALREKGESALPLVLADGQIASEGVYPQRSQLAAIAELEQPTGAYTPAVEELVAIGAAIASNCEPCLSYHVEAARRLGVAEKDIAQAVQTARKVKETPARAILKVADALLRAAGEEPSPADARSQNGSGCGCGTASEATPEPAASRGEPVPVAAGSASGSCC
jgi:AhpD family alkylhydroperoxidase